MGSLIKLVMMILLLINFIFNSPSEQQRVPEICDNALDDDNDGQIDLNDDDCYCEPLEQNSLIPNPSFEDQECCPTGHSSLNCAKGWIQASEGSTDYFHSCDYDGTDIFTIPQPIPDGEGFVGIIDGSFTGNFNPALKEYAGACLLTPLKPDILYRLEFYTGFLNKRTSPDIEIALFGTADCANLPFGIGDKSFGCPSNSPLWVQLGSVHVSGENQWVKSQFKIRPRLEIAAIAFGPACAFRSATNNTYHFLDQIILKENDKFDLGIKRKGEPCTNDLVFEVSAQEGSKYQWYKNGIAIPGAVENNLRNPPGRGQYQVRLENSEGCKISNIYVYTPPSQFVQASQTICAGESFSFNNRQLTKVGVYWDTLTSINNCDSIVQLEILVDQAVETNLSTKIFPNESFRIGSYSINSPGEHVRTLSTVSGCDSTIYLHLEYYAVYIPNAFSPNGDLVNDVFAIYGDSDLKEINSLNIFDRWGALVYRGEALRSNEGWDGTINGQKAPIGIYAYTAQVVMTDNKNRILHGMLTLMR